MKSFGIVRKIDNLGRIVLPVELRRTLDIELRDPIEIYLEGEYIMLKKYSPACILCGESSDLIDYKRKKVCKKCVSDIKAT